MPQSRTEPEDLWKIYKAVKQRFNRSTNIGQKLLAEEAMLAMKQVLQKTVTQNALLFSVCEKSYLDHENTKKNAVNYSNKVITSIYNNNFTSSKPKYNIPSLSNSDPEQGYLYLASSCSKVGQIKIGYTTMDLKKRMQKLKLRYGYTIKVVDFAFVQYPARLEQEIHKQLSTLRVSGLTSKESNEWFYCDTKLATSWIEKLAEIMDLDVMVKTWP
jgi:T5orf172 domain